MNIIIILLTALTVFFSNGRTLSITDRSIVHAVGIDKSQNGLKITLQIFKPEAAGSDTPIDISKANFKTVSAQGKSASEAIGKLSSQLGTEIFFGHLQLIVIGEDVTFIKPNEIFEPFISNKSIYRGVYIASAKNAGEIVSFPIKENAVTAENYKGIIETAQKRGISLKTTLADIERQYRPTGSLALTHLELIGDGDEKRLIPTGSSILTDAGIKGRISEEECALFSLFTNKSECNIRIKNASGDYFVLENAKCSFDVESKNNAIQITANIGAFIGADKTKCQQLAIELENSAGTLFDKYYKEGDTDILGIYRHVRQQKPALYQRYKSELYKLYEITDFDIRPTLTEKSPSD